MKQIRFDTRDKKPKLYWLLVPVIGALSAAAALLFADAERYAPAVCLIAAALCSVVVAGLLHALHGQLQYNPYSYNTIYYIGFALFMLFVLVTYVVLAVRLFTRPDLYHFIEILHILLSSAKAYMFWTFPFLLVFSCAMCVSNIALIRHEGKRPVNLLGILLSLLIVAGEVFLFVFDYAVSGSQTQVMIHDLVANLGAAIYLYFECMLIGTVAANVIVVRYRPQPDKDFLIVLGCGIRKDGTPTPLLRGRLDRALSFAREQERETGKLPVFITSGGQGSDEVIPESTSMKRYLTEQGIPAERIVEEDRSTDTAENMRFSKEIIRAMNPDGKVAFSTTNYHVFRSGLSARRVKMRAVGIGAKTKWYYWPNAAVREFVGLLTKHRVKQGVILGTMIVSYVIITLLAYR